MFGNILMYQTTLLDAAIEIFRHPEVARRDFPALTSQLHPVVQELRRAHETLRNTPGGDRYEIQDSFNRFYCYERILEELPGFFRHLDQVHSLLGDDILHPATDRVEAAVGLVSHTYFLTYTYPPMPFIPFSPMAAQRLDFADRIDYFEFKGLFSDPDVVRGLGYRLCQHPEMWTRTLDFSSQKDSIIRRKAEAANGTPYNPYGMIKGMIERLGELAPGIDYDAVQKGIRWYLGHLGCIRIVHSDRERRFLENVDRCLEATLLSLVP
jgi:hypothetical protein